MNSFVDFCGLGGVRAWWHSWVHNSCLYSSLTLKFVRMFANVIELDVLNSLGRFKFSLITFQRNWTTSYAGELIL